MMTPGGRFLASIVPLPAGRAPMLSMRLATVGFVLAVLDGLGTYNNLFTYPERLYLLGELVLIGAAVVLSPRTWVTRVRLPLAAVAFVTWWLMSSQWSAFPPLFIRSTTRPLITILGVVILGQLMPRLHLQRAILRTGYIAFGLTTYALLALGDSAFSSTVGGIPTEGFSGGFGHKNTMAPCLLLGLAATLCFERRRWVRRLVFGATVFYLVIGQTGTGLATMFVMVIAYLGMIQWRFIRARFGSTTKLVGSALLVIAVVVVLLLFQPILSLYGKDLTFTGRTEIWRGVINAISKRPWHGYGWGGVFTNFAIEPTASINRPLGYTVAHSHNAVLEMALRLGFVAVGIYLLQFVRTFQVGARLLRLGDTMGHFVILLLTIVSFFAVSEVQTVFGAWFGLTVLLSTVGPDRRSDPPLPRTVHPPLSQHGPAER
ncbi:MAG: O-antigen ligase family protein, partial [Ilumatobacteraceae bacterium]